MRARGRWTRARPGVSAAPWCAGTPAADRPKRSAGAAVAHCRRGERAVAAPLPRQPSGRDQEPVPGGRTISDTLTAAARLTYSVHGRPPVLPDPGRRLRVVPALGAGHGMRSGHWPRLTRWYSHSVMFLLRWRPVTLLVDTYETARGSRRAALAMGRSCRLRHCKSPCPAASFLALTTPRSFRQARPRAA